jgi:hypothetical protein
MTTSYRDSATEKIELAKIEALPLADIKVRLEELGLPSSIPAYFQKTIMSSAPSPAANLLSLLDDPDDEDVECMPLAEVTAHLQELGINYRAGLAETINLAEQQQAHEATVDSSERWQVPVKEASWVRSIVELIGSLIFPNRIAMAIASASIAVVALIIPIREEMQLGVDKPALFETASAPALAALSEPNEPASPARPAFRVASFPPARKAVPSFEPASVSGPALAALPASEPNEPASPARPASRIASLPPARKAVPSFEPASVSARALAALPASEPNEPASPATIAPKRVRTVTVHVERPIEAAAKASPLGESWVVQLSAQKTEAEAQSAFRAMQTMYSVLGGHVPLIRKKDRVGRGVFYAAQVGPLARAEANKLCESLKSAGGSCFIQKSSRLSAGQRKSSDRPYNDD